MIATLRLELNLEPTMGYADAYWTVTVSGHAGTQGADLEDAMANAEEMARALLEVPEGYQLHNVRTRITGDVIERDVVFLP
jgi:predicted RNase H-like HicB family nuclease